MTCIAWDGKVLAADRMSVSSTGMKCMVRKVHRVATKDRGIVLVGAAGSFQDGVLFMEWLRGGAKPEKLNNFQAVVIDRKRRVWNVEENLAFGRIASRRYAIGSGRGAAMGALYAGKSAVGAIKIAAKVYCDVGLGVDAVRF